MSCPPGGAVIVLQDPQAADVKSGNAERPKPHISIRSLAICQEFHWGLKYGKKPHVGGSSRIPPCNKLQKGLSQACSWL